MKMMVMMMMMLLTREEVLVIQQGELLREGEREPRVLWFLLKNQWKFIICWVLDHFPAATKRTRPAESIFAIRFERKLIFFRANID